jgi:hypothetical protein
VEQIKPETLTLREYARQQGITLQSAYRRIWNGKVPAERLDGRWIISADGQATLTPARVSDK